MINKLILGTANFGMEYGVAFGSRVSKEEVFRILDRAYEEGFWGVDTAQAYGEAEALVGEYMQARGKRLRVITKLENIEYASKEDVRNSLEKSLKRLKVGQIDCLMLHSMQALRIYGGLFKQAFKEFKEESLIKSYGVSVYHPEEVLEAVRVLGEGLCVEFPLNLFDHRFTTYLENWKCMGLRLFVRSVFLQGLFFLPDEKLKGRFEKVKDKIKHVREVAQEKGLSVSCLCLCFAFMHEPVEGFVVGVDSLSQLEENIKCLKSLKVFQIDWGSFRVVDEDIILPYRWR
ncbi:MAG: aldo/keto reductase [Geminocystis sp.]|nr:aldo/keto reductase [Geminocystis sp.]